MGENWLEKVGEGSEQVLIRCAGVGNKILRILKSNGTVYPF